MTKLRFILGGALSVAAIRVYKSWEKMDPKTVDEIVELSLHTDY